MSSSSSSLKPACSPLGLHFFQRPPLQLAVALLGKVLFRRVENRWLACRIIETEAYYRDEKASHSSLGRTPSREAMFMPAGTLYLYYSRGKPSLNISAEGAGNAVLIKSGVVWQPDEAMVETMLAGLGRVKPVERLCSGQTLLCEALHLKVEAWNKRQFDPERFFIADVGASPEKVVQTRRLGIAPHRDAHLPYRFVDAAHCRQATQNPCKRSAVEGRDYWIWSWHQALELQPVHRND